MSKRWSKLQSRLYNLMEPSLNFQIHYALYTMHNKKTPHGCELPRCFITVGKEIVFDYPKEHDTTNIYGFNSYIWDGEISRISNFIEEYIQCPESDLMKDFENDRWKLANVLRTCDRRMGKRRLAELKENVTDERLLKIIEKRLVGTTEDI